MRPIRKFFAVYLLTRICGFTALLIYLCWYKLQISHLLCFTVSLLIRHLLVITVDTFFSPYEKSIKEISYWKIVHRKVKENLHHFTCCKSISTVEWQTNIKGIFISILENLQTWFRTRFTDFRQKIAKYECFWILLYWNQSRAKRITDKKNSNCRRTNASIRIFIRKYQTILLMVSKISEKL